MVRSMSPFMMVIMRSTPAQPHGHETVEIGAADHGEPGAEGDGCNDVGA